MSATTILNYFACCDFCNQSSAASQQIQTAYCNKLEIKRIPCWWKYSVLIKTKNVIILIAKYYSRLKCSRWKQWVNLPIKAGEPEVQWVTTQVMKKYVADLKQYFVQEHNEIYEELKTC